VKKLTIIGAGWSGLACAVAATQAGWQVELFEAANEAGGRARSLEQSFAGVPLDNGQHILLGAYRDTLQVMRTVGVNPEAVLLRLPLDLRTADGLGFKLPSFPSYSDKADIGATDIDLAAKDVTGLDETGATTHSSSPDLRVTLLASLKLLHGVAFAKGWSTTDKWRLLQACWRWQITGFTCDAAWSVLQLCEAAHLTPRVVQGLIEPLCLSALNMPLQSASAAVFLRVLHDAMLSAVGSSDLLIPKTDLGALFPQACLQWLRERGAKVYLGRRFTQDDLVQWRAESDEALLKVPLNRSLDAALNTPFDASLNTPSTAFVKKALVLACPAWEAARLTQAFAPEWSARAQALSHTAIATVYLQCHDAGFKGLNSPMVTLQMGPNAPRSLSLIAVRSANNTVCSRPWSAQHKLSANKLLYRCNNKSPSNSACNNSASSKPWLKNAPPLHVCPIRLKGLTMNAQNTMFLRGPTVWAPNWAPSPICLSRPISLPVGTMCVGLIPRR
jgi:hypothetical protein